MKRVPETTVAVADNLPFPFPRSALGRFIGDVPNGEVKNPTSLLWGSSFVFFEEAAKSQNRTACLTSIFSTSVIQSRLKTLPSGNRGSC